MFLEIRIVSKCFSRDADKLEAANSGGKDTQITETYMWTFPWPQVFYVAITLPFITVLALASCL